MRILVELDGAQALILQRASFLGEEPEETLLRMAGLSSLARGPSGGEDSLGFLRTHDEITLEFPEVPSAVYDVIGQIFSGKKVAK